MFEGGCYALKSTLCMLWLLKWPKTHLLHSNIQRRLHWLLVCGGGILILLYWNRLKGLNLYR